MRYKCTVPGRPVPAVRMTQRSKWSPEAQHYLAYERAVAYAALAAKLPRPLPWDWVGIEITIYLKAVRDRAGLRLPRNAGDIDNYCKSVIDGLQHGGIFKNDRCVIALAARMLPCRDERAERVELTVWAEEGNRGDVSPASDGDAVCD